MNAANVIDARTIANACGGAKPSGEGWTCNCPTGKHTTPKNTLKVTDRPGQLPLVHCHGGCEQPEVIAALREMKLWPAGTTPTRTATAKAAPKSKPAAVATKPTVPSEPTPRNFAELAPRYGLKADDFTQAGCTIEKGNVRYPLIRPDGTEGAKIKSLARMDGKRTARHEKGGPGFFPRDFMECPPGPLVVTGGEEKALAVWCAGLYGVTPSTGEGTLPKGFAEYLVKATFTEFIVAMDADNAGREGAKKVAQQLKDAGATNVRVCRWDDGKPDGYDLNDVLRYDGADALQVFLESAEPFNAESMREQESGAEVGQAVGDILAGRLLADQTRGRFIYVSDRKLWSVYDGKRWKSDDGGMKIMREAKKAAKKRRANAPADTNHPENKAAMRGCDTPKLKNAIEMTQSEDGMFASFGEFDADPWTLNCNNGTLNLQTGKLMPHDPSDKLTKLAPVDFDPEATAPVFARFLDETTCGDNELKKYLLRSLGYCLTGDCREQIFYIFHGNGQNGKGRLIAAMDYLMGDYCTPIETASLMTAAFENRGGTREDLVAMKGARLVLASELNKGRLIDEACVKTLTGQDAISARPLYGRQITFHMTGKIVLSGNHLPGIQGRDEGIWRRIRRIPFNYEVPKEKRDNQMDEKLRKEAPGILAQLVQACLDWQANGLPECRAVKEASEAYRKKSDILGDFFADCVKEDPHSQVPARKLHQAYMAYSGNGLTDKGPSEKAFASMMIERGYKKKPTGGGSVWLGIDLMVGYGELNKLSPKSELEKVTTTHHNPPSDQKPDIVSPITIPPAPLPSRPKSTPKHKPDARPVSAAPAPPPEAPAPAPNPDAMIPPDAPAAPREGMKHSALAALKIDTDRMSLNMQKAFGGMRFKQ